LRRPGLSYVLANLDRRTSWWPSSRGPRETDPPGTPRFFPFCYLLALAQRPCHLGFCPRDCLVLSHQGSPSSQFTLASSLPRDVRHPGGIQFIPRVSLPSGHWSQFWTGRIWRSFLYSGVHSTSLPPPVPSCNSPSGRPVYCLFSPTLRTCYIGSNTRHFATFRCPVTMVGSVISFPVLTPPHVQSCPRNHFLSVRASPAPAPRSAIARTLNRLIWPIGPGVTVPRPSRMISLAWVLMASIGFLALRETIRAIPCSIAP